MTNTSNPAAESVITAFGGPEELERMVAEHQRQAELARKLMDADPRLPFVSAFVIAGDRLRADEQAWPMLEAGTPYRKAAVWVGSYARVDFALRAMEAGYLDRDALYRALPDLWSGSDPDDTDPRFLALWLAAREAKGNYLRDGKALPRSKALTLYRGQDEGAPFGIAWSLDADVAGKFARGAATRQHNRDGVVYVANVERDRVLGYMTGRNEAEVIIDPARESPFVVRPRVRVDAREWGSR